MATVRTGPVICSAVRRVRFQCADGFTHRKTQKLLRRTYGSPAPIFSQIFLSKLYVLAVIERVFKTWGQHGVGGIDDQSPDEQVPADVLDGARRVLHVAGKGGD